MKIDKRKEDHGVITIADLDTSKKPATRFMINQQIDENSTPFKPSLFSKEQLELLQKMFGQSQQAHVTSMIGTRALAQKGNFLNALNVKRENMSLWIVDSRASDHMTGNANIFHKYSPCHENFTVMIVDGSLSKVADTNSIVISKNLNLDSVLLVPNLDCNLSSIRKLT